MTTARIHSYRALALVDRLQRLLAERQELLMQEDEEDYLPLSRGSGREARLAELQAEMVEALDALAVLVPPEFPGRFSRSASVA
jgi:hypothetical protein